MTWATLVRSRAEVNLVIVWCWCGIPYAIPDDLSREMKRNKQQSSYCPLGHSMVYQSGNEERIRQLEATLQAERDQHHATRNTLRTTKGHLTKTKRRIERGVCIHCHRSFANVVRHMQSQHPETKETT